MEQFRLRQDFNIYLIYIYTFLIGMAFLLPVVVPYYRDELGLSFQDFLIGEAVFATVVIVLEVPTGWIADVWGRRKTLILSAFCGFLGYGTLLIANDLWDACLGQGIIGIAVALNSGAISAMLYDSLLSSKCSHEYRQREGFRHGLGLYAVASAALIGGVLYQIDHRWPLYAELVALLLAIVSAMLMTEPQRHERRVDKHPLADMLDVVRYTLHGHREIAVLIMTAALIFSTTKIFLWSQQPYYHALAIPESMFGILMSGAMLCGGLAAHLGHRIRPGISGITVVQALLLSVVILCVLAGSYITYFGLAILLSNSVFWGFGWPRVQEVINHAVGSERRATVLSTASLAISLAFIPLSLIVGWIEDGYGIGRALLIHAVIIGLLGSFFSVMLWRRKG